MDTRDARVFSGVSPGDQLSGILRARRTRAGGGVSRVAHHVDRGRGGQKQGEDLRGDSPTEHALLERAVWEGGPNRPDLRESLAGPLKKNLLCTWNRCGIHVSNFSCGILTMRSSVPTR